MSRKTLQQRIDESLSIIEKQQKAHDLLMAQFNEKEEKDRVHRFCKRGGYVEKYIPELKTLTDKQFYSYVEKVMMTDDAKLILMEISEEAETPDEPKKDDTTGQDSGAAASKPVEASAQPHTPPAPKPTETLRNNGTNGNRNGGNGVGQTNTPPAQRNTGAAQNGGTGGSVNGGKQYPRVGYCLPPCLITTNDERSITNGNIPIKHKNIQPGQRCFRRCQIRVPGGGANQKRL